MSSLCTFVTSILAWRRGRLDAEEAGEPPLRQIVDVLQQVMCAHDAESLLFLCSRSTKAVIVKSRFVACTTQPTNVLTGQQKEHCTGPVVERAHPYPDHFMQLPVAFGSAGDDTRHRPTPQLVLGRLRQMLISLTLIDIDALGAVLRSALNFKALRIF